MECIKQNMLGSVSTEAFKASFKLGREGDLINKMHFTNKITRTERFFINYSTYRRAAINFTLGTNILSHIEITNNGRDYIFGATVSVNVSDLGTFMLI